MKRIITLSLYSICCFCLIIFGCFTEEPTNYVDWYNTSQISWIYLSQTTNTTDTVSDVSSSQTPDVELSKIYPLLPKDDTTSCSTGVTAQWNSVYAATQYRLELDATESFVDPIRTVFTKSTYLPINGLDNGTYYWRIRAENEFATRFSEGEWSLTYFFHIENLGSTALLLPQDQESLVSTYPLFIWEPINLATTYILHYDTTDTFSNPIEIETSETTFQPTSPLDSGIYYWKVKVLNESCEGYWSAIFSFTIQ
jgi:hypothetical protein